jgi:hypothetical protein
MEVHIDAQITAQVEWKIRAAIASGCGPEIFLSIIRELSRASTDQTRRLLQNGRRGPSCARGCTWCCYLKVSATVPEVLLIAEHIRTTWTTRDTAALRNLIVAHRENTAGLDPYEHRRSQTACPLLKAGICSVYEVRPQACVAWHSFEVNACCRASTAVVKWAEVPYSPRLAGVGWSVRVGIETALQRCARRPISVELIAALEIALRPGSAAHWLLGGGGFEGAAVLESRTFFPQR